MGPTIDALASEYEGKAVIGKLDVGTEEELAAEHGFADALPALVFFKDGKEVDRIYGLVPKTEIMQKLDSLIGG